jgi:hypothetical protein
VSTGAFIGILILGVIGFAATVGLLVGFACRWAAREERLMNAEAERIVADEICELERLYALAARTPARHR